MKPIGESPLLRFFGGLLARAGVTSTIHTVERIIAGEETVIRESDDPLGVAGFTSRNRISRDLSPAFLRRMRAEAFRAQTQNPIAKKALKLRRAFVCQEGFKLESDCGNPIVQQHLDEHWLINWERQLHGRVDFLSSMAEWAYLIPEVNRVNGHFEMGQLEPDKIERIDPSPRNIEKRGKIILAEPLEIVLTDGSKSRRKDFDVVNFNWLTKQYEGEVLFLGINCMSTMMRGLSDLLPVLDWLEGFEQLTWVELERLRNMRAFLWHRVIKGAEEPAIKKAAQEWAKRPPKPGTCYTSNENETLTALAPDLNSGESLEYLKFLFGIIWGGLDLPEHFFYTGGDVNRASAKEMGDPVYAAIRDRKTDVCEFMVAGGQIAIDRAREVEGHDLRRVPLDELGVKITSRDPERSSYDVMGTQLNAFAGALVIAQTSGWISETQAGKQFREAAGALGLGEIPAPDEESDTIADAQQATQNALDAQKEELMKTFPFAVGNDPKWAIQARQGRPVMSTNGAPAVNG